VSRWIILRTSGPQTLPLMRSLCDAGLEAWTPARTIRKVVRKGTRTEQRIEIDVPILPTFVFAREQDLPAFAELIAMLPYGAHPAFSIFRYRGRIPLVAESEVAGLRAEEREEARKMQEIRDAESHQAAARIRIAAMKAEQAEHRAAREMARARLADLRAQSRRAPIAAGTAGEVVGERAFTNVVGVVEGSDGSATRVRFGSCSWKIDGWRLSPSVLESQAA
jgi:hypothetical protein